jgi:ABC-type phosphate transport system auxiliary subunit
MATQTFFDFNAMIVELERLEQQERKVSEIRRQLHDRLDAFPNEAAVVKERKISDARRALHNRIDALKAELDIWGR